MARLELFKLMEKVGLSADFTEESEKTEARQPLHLLEADPSALVKALEKQKDVYCQPAYTEGRVQALYCAYEGEAACLEDPESLRALWDDSGIRLILHDSKPFFTALLREGIQPQAPSIRYPFGRLSAESIGSGL